MIGENYFCTVAITLAPVYVAATTTITTAMTTSIQGPRFFSGAYECKNCRSGLPTEYTQELYTIYSSHIISLILVSKSDTFCEGSN